MGQPDENRTAKREARLKKSIERIEMIRSITAHLREQLEKYESIDSAPVHEVAREDETLPGTAEDRRNMNDFAQALRQLERHGSRMTVRDGKDVLIMDLAEINALKRQLAWVLRRDPETRRGLAPCTNGECERIPDTSSGVYTFDGRIYDCDGGHD